MGLCFCHGIQASASTLQREFAGRSDRADLYMGDCCHLLFPILNHWVLFLGEKRETERNSILSKDGL